MAKGRKAKAKTEKKRQRGHNVPNLGDPFLALQFFKVPLADFRRYLKNLGQIWYPDLGVLAPARTYDENRPEGWPTALSLCKAAGLAYSTASWAPFCSATVGMEVVSPHLVAIRSWQKRRENADQREPLTENEKTGVSRRDVFGHRAGRSKLAKHHQHRQSYRGEYFGAIKSWVPIMEWCPLQHAYVQTGAYSVWQLI
jgi:hypothetical protein